MRLAEPELMELRHGDIGIEALGLVDREQAGLPLRRASCAANTSCGVTTRAAIDQNDQPVGLRDGALRLLHHQALDAIGILDEAAGIDHDAGHGRAAGIIRTGDLA